MADTATEDTTESTGRGVPVKFVVIGLVVLLALAGAYLFVLAPSGDEPDEPAAPTYSDEGGQTMVVSEGATLSVGGERRYAMLTYSVQPAMDADTAMVEMEFARMRSEVQRVVLGYDADELLTPGGVEALEDDLEAVAAEIWPEGEVLEVYLENIVVQ